MELNIRMRFMMHSKIFQDTILLVDKGEKQVSSTVGHDLMHDHPFAERRFAQAHENLDKLIPVFENGNIEEFIKNRRKRGLNFACDDDDFVALFYFDETQYLADY